MSLYKLRFQSLKLDPICRTVKIGLAMMNKHAFMVAGTHSGVGKTTLSLALMAYFKSKGFIVQPFKVGPDFIDPGLHTLVTGRSSRNLDGWMLSEEYNKRLFNWASLGADVSIVEAVMGFYDGYDGISESGSSAQMAKWLDIPVVLVIDAKSMARSVAAIVYGFTRFSKGITWAGVILNRVGSYDHFRYLEDAISYNFPDIPILGWIPYEKELTLPERHLGLVTAEETSLGKEWIEKATEIVEKFIKVELLLEKTLAFFPKVSPSPFGDLDREPIRVTVAVPKDAAFCFYYQDNLDLLEHFGASLAFFSPLAGETIPADARILYIGGGYPEVHAGALSANQKFLKDLKLFAMKGFPIYAECGGLMVLSQFIEDLEGKRWPMAKIMPFGTKMLGRRRALGYVEVVFEKDFFLGSRETIVKGHEFHYSDLCWDGEEKKVERVYRVFRRRGGEGRYEGFLLEKTLSSYVHQHWGSNINIAYNFCLSGVI